jgi:CheY-like chemotaxis protein
VRRLVELHGGTVQAISDGPGKGSEFVMRLPAAPARSRGEELEPDEAAMVPSAQCCSRILIADDNVDAASSLATLLELSGHTVRVVHDGSKALAAAAELRPDVILLDIGMPCMNGYDVCRAIRRQPWAEHTPIVAITGWGQEDDRRRAIDAGFTHHITKPVNLAQLERLIRA